MKTNKNTIYDIAIIGAGVSGCMIAREMSMFDLNICVLDKAYDVSSGASKANSAIVHAGYDPIPGTLKSKLNARGAKLMKAAVKELEVEYKVLPSLVLAYDEEQMNTVLALKERADDNGVSVKTISREEVLTIEPMLNPDVVGALYADSAIVCPYGLTIAAAENAAKNGVEFKLGYEVSRIETHESLFIINDDIKTKYIINAAGVNSAEIASLIGDLSFSITPRRGEYMIYDKQNLCVNSVLFTVPTKLGKGVLITPSVSGNMLVGPNAQVVQSECDIQTTSEGQNFVFENAKRIIPSLTKRGIIREFAGIRATPSGDDFIIRFSEISSKFLHVAGIESPGLASSPAVAEYVLELLKNSGLRTIPKKSSTRYRKQIRKISEATAEEAAEMIAENPLYSHVICRCETISEAEIVEAIHRPIGARSVDAVKFRTRAGMGRCQGGFCSPKVAEILSRELNIPLSEVTQFGGNSKILCKKQ